MSSYPLQSNQELYEYLVQLSEKLGAKGEGELAEGLKFASRFSLGSPSEFLHESQEILRKVRDKKNVELAEAERRDIADVIRQIEIAFIQIGGA